MGWGRRRGVGRGSRAGRRVNRYDGLPARSRAGGDDVFDLDQGGGSSMRGGRSSGRRRGSASSGRSSAAGRRSRGGRGGGRGDEFDEDEGGGRSSRAGASAGRGMDQNTLYALIGLGAVVLLVLVIVLATRGGGNKPPAGAKRTGASTPRRKTSGASTAGRTTNPQPAPVSAGRPPLSKDTFISPDVARGLGGGPDPNVRPLSEEEIRELNRDPYSGGGK